MIELSAAIILWLSPALGGDALQPEQNQKSAQQQLLIIHYHRFDADYDQADIWTWDEKRTRPPGNEEIFPVGRDDWGLIFKLDPIQYGRPGERIGLVPRLKKDWNFKDGEDRYWSPEMGYEVYIVEGRKEVYTSRPDVSPRLLGATLDDLSAITLRFTHALPPIPLRQITVRDQTGAVQSIAAVVSLGPSPQGKTRAFTVQTEERLDVFDHTYEIEVHGFEPCRVRLGRVLTRPQFQDPDAQMGATYTPTATTFRLFSPMADAVDVLISDLPTGGQDNTVHSMTRNEHGLWSATTAGDLTGRYYAYKLRGPGLDPKREVTDVSATCAQGLDGRALIANLDATEPPGFNPAAYVKLDSPVDAIIWEVHVRDFSIAPNSGIAHQGQYLGLTETGSHLPDNPEIKTGLEHLVELGVTHVHLLPVQDFENNESENVYNWGYVTVFFNTPEGWFATTPDGDARIREFKRTVQTLHHRGLGVVMDVVYNHTSSRATFELTAPGYCFRMKPDGSLWNGSGCGNEVASEHPMVRKFIIDSLVFWATEYGIDGFRFDLMGLIDLETMLAIRDRLRQINPSVLLYGEPWTGGPSGLSRITDHSVIRGTGLAAFNDHFRDAIKGDRDGGAPGFIQTGDRIDGVMKGTQGAIHDWALHPTGVINYCEAHDNLTTWDKIVQSAPDAPDEIKKRMQCFAGLLVLTAQGIPFLHAGQEFCRSKGGNHNSYNAPDRVNQIDWSLKKTSREVFNYYKGLITLRKAHPLFRLRTREEVEQRFQFLRSAPTSRCVVYRLDGRQLEGEGWNTVLVLLNGESTDQTFSLPPGAWKVVVDADRAGPAPLYETAEKVSVVAHSGAVLFQ
ncbi:MAG: type I pullulanase [Planctomycetota bacterium]